jgi:serine protease Do
MKKTLLGGLAMVAMVTLVALALVSTGPAAEAAKISTPASFAPLVKLVSPAVVNIRTVRKVEMPRGGFHFRIIPGQPFGPNVPPGFRDHFRRFFPYMPNPQPFYRRGQGTGFIIGQNGFILTNYHVVAHSTRIKVQLADRREFPAKVVGRDPRTDIALIKIKAPGNLPVVKLGDSGRLQPGDWVIAIGNPFGLGHTVTAGIVSAVGRIAPGPLYGQFIQTDASINPGNSGGPLINMAGEVIGINTAIFARGQGIGFAIPINLAKRIVAELKSRGRVIRGFLGVHIQPVTAEMASYFGLKRPRGALVASVMPGTPAAKAGLKTGDIILSFNGKDVDSPQALQLQVAAAKVGSHAKVGLWRNKKRVTVTVKLIEMPKAGKAAKPGKPGPGPKQRLGLSLQAVTPDLAASLGLKKAQGLVVTNVQSGSPGDQAGLRVRDVILQVNQKAVSTPEQFWRATQKMGRDKGVLLLVSRRGRTFYRILRSNP